LITKFLTLAVAIEAVTLFIHTVRLHARNSPL